MGPFPHDAPPATISATNPAGTDGFEFVEYAHPNPGELHALFRLMGYSPVARHKTKKITVYRQGDINYLVNEEPGSHGYGFVAAHGPCAPSMAFRVVDAKLAYERALSLGAEPADVTSAQKTLDVPAIKGIGGAPLYLIDRFEDGKVVDASAEQGEEFLIEMLDTDEGARRLGELGIGTNFGISTATKEILLDEKIGGTVHMAIGMAYPESGGTNSSAVHWDMVCDLRRGGSISVDGEELQRDGKFLV